MLKKHLDAIMTKHPFYNLNEGIYETLCQSIIDLTLEPGQTLSETALSNQLSVSRSPVRNALLRLQSDGLVTQTKGQSFQVAAISKEDCRDGQRTHRARHCRDAGYRRALVSKRYQETNDIVYWGQNRSFFRARQTLCCVVGFLLDTCTYCLIN